MSLLEKLNELHRQSITDAINFFTKHGREVEVLEDGISAVGFIGPLYVYLTSERVCVIVAPRSNEG